MASSRIATKAAARLRAATRCITPSSVAEASGVNGVGGRAFSNTAARPDRSGDASDSEEAEQ